MIKWLSLASRHVLGADVHYVTFVMTKSLFSFTFDITRYKLFIFLAFRLFSLVMILNLL